MVALLSRVPVMRSCTPASGAESEVAVGELPAATSRVLSCTAMHPHERSPTGPAQLLLGWHRLLERALPVPWQAMQVQHRGQRCQLGAAWEASLGC